MAFGQSAGPPASPRQLDELRSLVERAGHADFRDARGPLGLNQRQAAGRFTRDEAAALIERLECLEHREQLGAHDRGDGAGDALVPVSQDRGAGRSSEAMPAAAALRVLRDVPSAYLAAELQRRGWLVLEP